ncbi:hypothetical protein FOL47_000238 [Perkinsus chesapeaki]|uniref:Uncharacterized protein n=1 Tax=Perkinsus chesapeaki TaxID=330153 RepID=A0A7J6MMB2_PERCH|nr:hypothetical protein FOL47_000238 [Perkinsus chesapeaki]
MWSTAATVHFPIVTREAYRVFLDHIGKNIDHLDANDAAVLASALMRNKEKMHSSLRKHVNDVARNLVKSLPAKLPSMTPMSIVQAAQLVPAGKVGTHRLIMQELATRTDITAATWGQILRLYAEGNNEWIGEVWGKINEALLAADGKTTAIVLNALARAHPKSANIRQFVLQVEERPRGWDVHSAAITCISMARLGQVQNAIDSPELDGNFAKLQEYLLTQDLRRSSMLQLKQIALGFSLAFNTKVSKELWKAIALAAVDEQIPGTAEDRIGVLGCLSTGYPLGKATREIEALVKSVGEKTDFRKLSSRSLNLFTMKLVKMRYFPSDTMAKVEACIVEDPDKFVPNGEAVLSVIHYLFACNSGNLALWKTVEAKLNALHETMRTEDLLPSVGFMTTSNRRPSESVATDVLARSAEPGADVQEALRALVGLCKADLALDLPVHHPTLEILMTIHKKELQTEVLRDCIDMVCQVALYSGSSELICEIICNFSKVKLRNTNMAWLAWSSAMLSSLELLPVSLIRSMLRVNLDYRHPVAGLCRDSRMARGVQEALVSLGHDFNAESVIGGFQIDFVST